MASHSPFEAWSKRSTALASPEPARPVSPAIASLFRKSGTAPSTAGTKQPAIEQGSAPPPATQDAPEKSPGEVRKTVFSTSSTRSQSVPPDFAAATSGDDALFRKRLALQRASNAWGPLLAAWSAASSTSRGAWTLPTLMAAIRDEAGSLANQASPGGAKDERLRMAFVAMMARCLAGEIRRVARAGHHLSQDAVANAALDMAALAEEPPAKALREPTGEAVLVRGRTSLAISLLDASIRLLPALAHHAGRSTGDDLDRLVGLAHRRAQTLAEDFLGNDAADKERQSLLQSLLRREVELLAAALETLPPGGLGSLGRGQAPLQNVIETYLRWSDEARQAVEASLDAGCGVSSSTQEAVFSG